MNSSKPTNSGRLLQKEQRAQECYPLLSWTEPFYSLKRRFCFYLFLFPILLIPIQSGNQEHNTSAGQATGARPDQPGRAQGGGSGVISQGVSNTVSSKSTRNPCPAATRPPPPRSRASIFTAPPATEPSKQRSRFRLIREKTSSPKVRESEHAPELDAPEQPRMKLKNYFASCFFGSTDRRQRRGGRRKGRQRVG